MRIRIYLIQPCFEHSGLEDCLFCIFIPGPRSECLISARNVSAKKHKRALAKTNLRLTLQCIWLHYCWISWISYQTKKVNSYLAKSWKAYWEPREVTECTLSILLSIWICPFLVVSKDFDKVMRENLSLRRCPWWLVGDPAVSVPKASSGQLKSF